MKYIINLRKLFLLLMKHNIIITLIKTFLNYSNINLLNRKVNLFDIIIIANKLKAINEIVYFDIFDDLKYYFNLINYLRSFVHYYAQLVNSL